MCHNRNKKKVKIVGKFFKCGYEAAHTPETVSTKKG